MQKKTECGGDAQDGRLTRLDISRYSFRASPHVSTSQAELVLSSSTGTRSLPTYTKQRNLRVETLDWLRRGNAQCALSKKRLQSIKSMQ